MSFLQYNNRLVLGGTQTGNSDRQFPIFAIMFSSKEPVSLRSCQILIIPIRDQERLRRRRPRVRYVFENDVKLLETIRNTDPLACQQRHEIGG